MGQNTREEEGAAIKGALEICRGLPMDVWLGIDLCMTEKKKKKTLQMAKEELLQLLEWRQQNNSQSSAGIGIIELPLTRVKSPHKT